MKKLLIFELFINKKNWKRNYDEFIRKVRE